MTDDFELVREYCRKESNGAFTELVDRHLDLVYSVAYRQVGGDEGLARDVCQEVFILLANSAKELNEGVVVSGWLYRTARFTALRAKRSESRRREREMEAQRMDEVELDEGVEDWEEVRPILDEAISELKELDRAAVCLRFYEKRSFSEIGQQLSLGENATRMRVNRALDKLNGVLSKKGIRSTSMALGAALAGQSALAAPIGLSVSIVNGIGLGSIAAGGSVVGTLITIMNMSKVSLVGVTLATSLLIGTAYYERGRLEAAQNEVEGLRADIEFAGDVDEELVALRHRIRDMKVREAQLEEKLEEDPVVDPNEVGPHGFTLLEMEESMEQWASRVGRVVDFVGKYEEFRIPEMDMLDSKEWLDAVGFDDISTEADFRMVLAKVRTKGKYKVQGRLMEAFRDFMEANPGEYPTEAADIHKYVKGEMDVSILDRYDVVNWEDKWPDRKVYDPVILFEERPADPIWENPSYFGPRISTGHSSKPGHSVWGSVDKALTTFESEMGRAAESVDEIRPFVEGEVREDLIDEIYRAQSTVVEMETNEYE